MKAGPKVAVDGSPLPLRGSRRRELAVARFATDYIRVPRGHGARKPLRLRPWQRSLIARLAKERRDSPRRIDAAVAAVMAHDRAAALAGVTRNSIYI